MTKYLLKCILILCAICNVAAQTGEIRGTIIEKATGEPMPGATVVVELLNSGTTTDLDGNYSLKVAPGTYTVRVSFVSFNTIELTDVKVEAGKTTDANVVMEEAAMGIEEVVITAVRRMNTEAAMLTSIRAANVVMSGVSSQQISKTQDRDASEVVKRVPGISIIDNRFIIARGLSQRYNNVWINGNAVPSTEADTRAFSFDMIPSGQIENLMIVKSPAPELPADFTGGFVKVTTKSVPEENSLQVSYGVNFNTQTHFRDFKYAKGSTSDVLGFDNGFRDMRSVVPDQLDGRNSEMITDVTANGFNNDWTIRARKPIADHRFSVMLNRFNKLSSGQQLGVVAALNYSCSYLNLQNMNNNRFGIYNKMDDAPVYFYKYEDDQYTTTVKVGGMLNLIWKFSDNHRIELRNIFNQQGRDRYTYRDGFKAVSGWYEQQKEEYLYSSRGTYTGQLSGIHTLSKAAHFDWTMGYSYANKNQPDRREINREKVIDQFDWESIMRQFIRLDEDTYSAGVNYSHIFALGSFAPSLKAGGYAEYRSRNYRTRYFNYNPSWEYEYLRGMDVVTEVMLPENFAADILFIRDASNKTKNDYSGENLQASGYMGVGIPFGKFNVYAGARYENSVMSLTNFVNMTSGETETYNYKTSDFFPSVNATYNINKTNLVRLAYGKSVNRQEFREVTPSAYYDFDLFSEVHGNRNLQQAYINNFDLRYEMYPSSGEMISLALFFKKFNNPIEWTFRDNGGSYAYTFENAHQANNYGVELDARKSLNFIGLPDWSLSFNGALIRSNVIFDENSLEHDRPMQGQSPYIVNTGLFYQGEKLNAGLMYNIIGKRIVGIGRNDHSGSIDNNVPDMYEMPRHALDLSLSYRFGKRVELSAGVRDILAAAYVFKQFPEFTVNGNGGNVYKREQTTKEYKPGQNFSVTLKLNL